MTDTPKKRALVVRGFKNEGTGERFAKDETPLLDAGTFANYEAAGLVTAAPPTKKTEAAPQAKKPRSKAKVASKPKSKPAAPAAPAPAPIVPAQPDVPPAGVADQAAD